MENKELDLTLANIASAKSKSLEKSRNQVKGAKYVTRDIVRRKKIEARIKYLLGAFGITAFIGIYGLVGETQFADEIIDEVVEQGNPEFKEDMLELNDFELHKLFNDTHKKMMEESGEKGPAVVEDVVARMEIDHEQANNKSK